ncbi:cytochrome c1 [Aurantiacibacter zhengii]|uniref:Cytochrome c1 n=1 Tax=Aurantiacibacter zhengii TaxID=2307003 RepID=A0A418NTC1_9SPHN|nr:cytochrome c1 [Aurantiacibacter zhengii]RIV86631.1 cytochrome c1 [Aurantiacibacter zhengii]
MIRLVGILIGLGFTFVVLLAFVTGAYTAATEDVAETAEHVFHEEAHGPEAGYSFDGPFGKWDLTQLQRGYQVYKEVCAACHSLNYVAIRDLEDLGYSEAQVKAEAATFQVPGVNPDTGEDEMRQALPTDYFPSPYPNAVAASAANGGKIPPDLSLMVKARHDGSNYLYNLLTGYQQPPAELAEEFPDFTIPVGGYYNPYFSSLVIGMPPPISVDGQVTYADGTEATISQMSQDVSAFLTWTAEPKLIERKSTGWPVLGFLLFATILAWLAKKQIWASAKPRNASRRED